MKEVSIKCLPITGVGTLVPNAGTLALPGPVGQPEQQVAWDEKHLELLGILGFESHLGQEQTGCAWVSLSLVCNIMECCELAVLPVLGL